MFSIKRSLFVATISWALLSSSTVLANEALPSVNLIDEFIEEFKYSFDESKTLEAKAFEIKIHNNNKKKNKKQSKNWSKKYGPVKIGFKVNPFNLGRNSVGIQLDLLESYKIISSQPNSISDLTNAFKADPDYHLIDPVVYKIIQGGLAPKEIWSTLSSLPNS